MELLMCIGGVLVWALLAYGAIVVVQWVLAEIIEKPLPAKFIQIIQLVIAIIVLIGLVSCLFTGRSVLPMPWTAG